VSTDFSISLSRLQDQGSLRGGKKGWAVRQERRLAMDGGGPTIGRCWGKRGATSVH